MRAKGYEVQCTAAVNIMYICIFLKGSIDLTLYETYTDFIDWSVCEETIEFCHVAKVMHFSGILPIWARYSNDREITWGIHSED